MSAAYPAVSSLSAAPASPAPAPVGIFDSGVGGLSVLRAVRECLPHESLIYCADTLYAPYGPRDDRYIAARTLAVCDWLLEQGAKAIVVACNTATAQTIHLVRERLKVPLIGVEPGIKPAALSSKSGVAGVLATAATLRSDKFQKLLAEYSPQCRFICSAGHGLVEAIEAGDTHSPKVAALLASYLEPMLEAGADTLVLGCTHYPFLRALIEALSQGRLALIDTGVAIARQLERQLTQHGLHADADAKAAMPPQFRLCSTGDGALLARLAQQLLGLALPVSRVEIVSAAYDQPPYSAILSQIR
ncbi:MAG: glutamate racemase [Janthinobacterium lividum]